MEVSSTGRCLRVVSRSSEHLALATKELWRAATCFRETMRSKSSGYRFSLCGNALIQQRWLMAPTIGTLNDRTNYPFDIYLIYDRPLWAAKICTKPALIRAIPGATAFRNFAAQAKLSLPGLRAPERSLLIFTPSLNKPASVYSINFQPTYKIAILKSLGQNMHHSDECVWKEASG